MSPARLIIDEPQEGAWNMAVDEALLESAAAGRPTLRFYQWREPTLSLGYFQSADERTRHAASSNCPLVRRSTGGGAIIHDRELTYSLALPLLRGRGENPESLYHAFHETLIEGLAEHNVRASLFSGESLLEFVASEPFLCFQRRAAGDVLVEGKKICGSAQRRWRNALLQHGSVLLAQSDCAPELPGVFELGGVPLSAADLAQIWLTRLESRLGFRFQIDCLTKAESQGAQRQKEEKFGHAGWNLRR